MANYISKYTGAQIDKAVGDVLNGNVGGTGGGGNITIDDTLTKAGAAADAKATGDRLTALSEEIGNISGGVSYRTDEYPASAFTLDHWIITGGVTTVDLTPASKTGWACIAIPCDAGAVATFSSYGGVGARAWAFVAEDGSLLNAAVENAQLNDYELVIPQKCTLVINAAVRSDYTYYLKVKVKVTANAVDGLKSRFATDAWFDADGWQEGHIQTGLSVGSTVDFETVTEANYSRLILECYAGMRFAIAGRGGAAARLWCFVDHENVINSMAEAYAENTEVEAPIDGKIIIQAETSNKSYPKSVQYTAYSLAPVAEAVKRLIPAFNGALVFGEGVNLKYETPEIPALPSVDGAEKLTHYYGLYDALVSANPDYVSKVDCDAELAAAGIARPDYYADYPTYMYKFIPAYTSNSNALDGVSDASKFKVYILSGTHPEMMSIWDLYNTMRLICEEWKNDESLEALRWQCEFYILPLACPYCVANATRPNYNGVDPNRNSPTSDWTLTASGTNTYSGPEPASEYETKLYAYYMQQIKPHVFIDHHNTETASDPGAFMYALAKLQSSIDVAAAHFSAMSRRWKKRYPEILPDNNTTIFGFARSTKDPAQRSTYGHECGAISYTIETNHGLAYDNGVPTSGAHSADAVACTIATDGFINFLLIALRNASQRISAQVVD